MRTPVFSEFKDFFSKRINNKLFAITKGADQLRGYYSASQLLYFGYIDRIIPLLSIKS